jgi:hypothetical protein
MTLPALKLPREPVSRFLGITHAHPNETVSAKAQKEAQKERNKEGALEKLIRRRPPV